MYVVQARRCFYRRYAGKADLRSRGRVRGTWAARCFEMPAFLQHSPELQHRRTLATYA